MESSYQVLSRKSSFWLVAEGTAEKLRAVHFVASYHIEGGFEAIGSLSFLDLLYKTNPEMAFILNLFFRQIERENMTPPSRCFR